MASQSAPRRGSGGRPTPGEARGQLLAFPETRSFGPFRWRTVKIASFAVLILLLSGALLQLFLVHALREGERFATGHGEGAFLTETIIARLTNDGEAKLVRSLLETYGIPASLAYDVPHLVYPNNVGEIRISVPLGLKDEALGILAAHREELAPPLAGACAAPPAAFPHPVPPAAARLGVDEEEEDDEDEWDDEDDDGDGDDDDEDAEIDDDPFDDEE